MKSNSTLTANSYHSNSVTNCDTIAQTITSSGHAIIPASTYTAAVRCKILYKGRTVLRDFISQDIMFCRSPLQLQKLIAKKALNDERLHKRIIITKLLQVQPPIFGVNTINDLYNLEF